MKILLLHNTYRIRGGEDVMVERELESLKAMGVDVIRPVISSREIAGLSGAIKTAYRMSYSQASKEQVMALISENHPDLVHVHNYFPLLTPSVFDACAEMGVPVVHTLHNFRMFCANGLLLREGKNCELCLHGSSLPSVVHGCYRDSSAASMPVAWMIERNKRSGIWGRSVTAFFCSTEFTRRKFVEAGVASEKIFVKPNFSPDYALQFTRKSEGYGFYLGRLSEEKGIRTLVSAWPKSAGPLLFCGDGPLAGWVAEQGFKVLSGKTHDEALALLARAHCLVMPSECQESGVPLVLMEALSLRVPVITSRFGAADQFFRAGENAWVFEPGDAEGLRRAVNESFSEGANLEGKARAGRTLYEREFHPQESGRRLLSLYQEVLGRSR